MIRDDQKSVGRSLPMAMLLAASVVALSVPATGQTEREDAVKRGLRFIGVTYGGIVDQSGLAEDALGYEAGDERTVLAEDRSDASLGVEAVWQVGTGFSGIHATFRRFVQEFTFTPDLYSWSQEDWPGMASVDFEQRMFGAAYVAIHGSVTRRFYWGAGYALSTGRASGRVETSFDGSTPDEQARLVEALFGFAAADSENSPLDFLQAAASRATSDGEGLFDLLGPEPPQPAGVYVVGGFLHTPGQGRFTWGANLEYFVDPELMDVNLLVGLRF